MAAPTLSLRSRLLAGIGVVAIVLVVVSVLVTRTTNDQLLEQVDDRLTLFSPDGRGIDRLPPPVALPELDPDRDHPEPGDYRERISDVYEGYVDAEDLRPEGPFGDHTGFYTPVDDYPTFHLTGMSMRRDALYSTTIVGPPPIRTSLPPAAFRAASSASAGDASMKWKVVPPSISIDGRG